MFHDFLSFFSILLKKKHTTPWWLQPLPSTTSTGTWAATSSGRSGHRRAQQTFMTSSAAPSVGGGEGGRFSERENSKRSNQKTQRDDHILYKLYIYIYTVSQNFVVGFRWKCEFMKGKHTHLGINFKFRSFLRGKYCTFEQVGGHLRAIFLTQPSSLAKTTVTTSNELQYHYSVKQPYP